jgi:SOS-response transcriptional repressor LexA
MSSWTTERASVAAHTQAGNHAAADAARQRLKALKVEEYIRKLVDSAPPLSDSQRDRLARLLRGTDAESQSAAAEVRGGDE